MDNASKPYWGKLSAAGGRTVLSRSVRGYRLSWGGGATHWGEKEKILDIPEEKSLYITEKKVAEYQRSKG